MVNFNKLEYFTKIANQHHCTLVAVTKTRPIHEILDMYNTGHYAFGENRASHLKYKAKELPEDIRWHFIGHLQSNKIKHILPYVYLIHSVDSFSLIEAIDKQAKKHNKIVNYLLQFHIAKENAKYGFDTNQVNEIVNYFKTNENSNTKCLGVMGMATFTLWKSKVLQEFKILKSTFDQLKASYFSNDEQFKEISMGMSGDYKLAIEAGSTMLRVGSALYKY